MLTAHGGGWLRFGLPGVALGLALAWGFDGRSPTARAQGPIPMPVPAASRAGAVAPAGETSGTVVFTSPAGGTAQLLYLVDTRSHALAVYKVDPSNPKGCIKLEAVRQYQWDLKLSEYNNLPPEVAAIESTVKSLGQPNR